MTVQKLKDCYAKLDAVKTHHLIPDSMNSLTCSQSSSATLYA